MKRRELITILEAALAAAHWSYAEAAALALLEGWPNDLEAQYGLARALAATHPDRAIDTLCRLTAADPQDAGAQALLGRLLAEQGRMEEARAAWRAVLLVRPDDVRAQAGAGTALPGWLDRAVQARRALRDGDTDAAFDLLHPSAQAGPAASWFLLLEASWRAVRWGALRAAATRARSRWPQAVLPALVLGASWMRESRYESGVVLLHDAAALDPTGQIAARLWGPGHPYRHLWPPPPPVELPGPLPAEVAALLGKNQLPPGPTVVSSAPSLPDIKARVSSRLPRPEAASPQPEDPALAALNAALTDAAAQAAGLSRKPDRFQTSKARVAVHLIVTHKGRLEARFGTEAAARLDVLLARLAQATERYARVLTDVIYIDRADTFSPPEDGAPVDIAAGLAALDAKLGEEGAFIGSVLIVGDDTIIPFYRLPNPVADGDVDICTDAPYAARTAGEHSVLIGERAIGRLPQPTAGELAYAIERTIAAHRRARPRRFSLWRAFLRWLRRAAPRVAPSLGYTASVWRSAAGAVYTALAGDGALHTSPPVTTNDWHPDGLAPARYGYFNLHGLQDVPHWYGQRDTATEPAYPDFPIALSPNDVVKGGRVVFTEACYGAYVLGKSAEDALALRFMACGTTGFVGATCIAYGSVSTPLTGADLLARRFWERLLAGYSQGRALRDAKFAFAREMHRRQGYLDTEDQKTLLSFVLYGDPTLYPEGAKSRHVSKSKRSQTGTAKLPQVRLAGPPAPAAADAVPNAVVQQVKGLMAPFLPGVYDAEVDVAVPSVPARGAAHTCAKGQSKGPGMILIFRKQHKADGAHPWQQMARVTLTKAGKVMKVVVTRGGLSLHQHAGRQRGLSKG